MVVCLKHQILLSPSQVFLDNDQLHYYAASQLQLNISNVTSSEEFIHKSLSIAQEIDWLSYNYIDFRGMTWLRNVYKSLLIKREFITKYSRTRFKYHEQQFADAFLKFYGEDFLRVIQPEIVNKLEVYLEYNLLGCDITQTIDRITHVLIIKFFYSSIRDIFN